MPNVSSFSAKTPNAKVNGTLTDNLPIQPVKGKVGRIAIGPRVTFSFINAPWDKNNTYQYYDVVLVEGSSYIARQNVPAGIDISNTDYWIHWADPNAQFNELYNIVMSFETRLQAVEAVTKYIDAGSTYQQMTEKGFAYIERDGE